MKAEKYFLILAAITGILCTPILSEEELISEHIPLLIGQANPVLEGTDSLFVTIINPGKELNELVLEKLKADINHKLNKAGIDVFSPEAGTWYKLPILPELKIRAEMLKLKESQQYVFHIETLLSKNIYVKTEPALRQKVDVWKTEPVMQLVSEENMPGAVAGIVLEQVETFIHAYLAANPPDKKLPTEKEISIVPKERPRPTVKSTPVEQKYVASKNSNVFHNPDCGSAKRIKSENLVNYSSRDEAINSGKRPCKRCKP